MDSTKGLLLPAVGAAVLAILASLVVFGMAGGISLVFQFFGLGSQTELVLKRGPGNESSEFRVALPATDGEIDIMLTPSKGVEAVDGAEVVDKQSGHYRVAECINGCEVAVVVAPPYSSGRITIDYLADDSEYVDEIELDGG